MSLADRTMDFTAVSGFVQTFLVTQEETGGRYVELEIVLRPGAGGAPLHVHPGQEERFEVKEGVVDVFHGGAWHTLKAGDVAVVPPGMPDQFKNTSPRPARLLCRLSPALDFQDMNVAVMRLINEGKIKSQRDLKSIIYSSMVLKRFPESLRMLNPTYRWTTSLFALVGRALGFSID
jgi:quercetin dioxygenase-like cupin family protein